MGINLQLLKLSNKYFILKIVYIYYARGLQWGTSIFFTSYPGFLAHSLVVELIESDHQIDHLYLLTLASKKNKAEHILHEIDKLKSTQVILIGGDITKQQLGLDPLIHDHLKKTVTHVFHLAAIYDLAVAQPTASKVNVKGTKHVTDWVNQLENLHRYIYFSTAFVSGKREGNIYEVELEMN